MRNRTIRWKAMMFGKGRNNEYHSVVVDTRDAGIGYIKGWVREDAHIHKYAGACKFKERKIEGNDVSRHVYMDGEYVGSVSHYTGVE